MFPGDNRQDKIRGEFLYMSVLKEKDPKLKLISHFHNHGNLGGGILGTYGPSPDDITFARRVTDEIFSGQSTAPEFKVWRFGTQTPYNGNGIIKGKK
jgi:hypothetical protein